MRICCFQSSYEGTDSAFEGYDQFQDPGRYVTGHDFHHVFVKKSTAREQIDEACAAAYDLYFNFMWGQESDSVAGVHEIRYLESKNIPFIGMPSVYLGSGKDVLAKAAKRHGVRVPRESRANFPLIVKPARGCGSLHMTSKSICHNEEELVAQLADMERVFEGKEKLIVQEFVYGGEYASIVLEKNDEVIALQPLAYEFPAEFSAEERWLNFTNKFDLVDQGVIKEVIVTDEALAERLKAAAVQAFRCLGVQGGGMWGRVDMRVNDAGEIFCLEVNQCPAVFYEIGNTWGDDWIIGEYFPGGHQGFFDTIVTSHEFFIAQEKRRKDWLGKYYAQRAHLYTADLIAFAPNVLAHFRTVIKNYDLTGSILDLGCGTGYLRNLLEKYAGDQIQLTGVDLASDMCKLAMEGGYVRTEVAPVQEAIQTFGDNSFDHIVSNGCLHFLNPFDFSALLQKAFSVAARSITISVEDIPDGMCESFAARGLEYAHHYNHTQLMESFQIPADWRVAEALTGSLWVSPTTGFEVPGTVWHFERVRGGVPGPGPGFDSSEQNA
ncbi:hypothetical protein BOTBODRAFT_51784 [Botryobasidium botryosum FD-172 SS1]|uniref:ATP-grasp domain-containing protein n=1 Tax=Botryobasidium botryosum (strain FD-172 SS1) TaxID=930990 RepID=A0A067MUF8_BOTB1|nr:hypothetical protein BOTBODRAFT_51784 [Botryobasidium botryosum FD-172 SS1]